MLALVRFGSPCALIVLSVCGMGCGSGNDEIASGAGYSRLAGHRALGGPVLAGSEVLVGSTRRGRARLAAFKLTGERRRMRLPGSEAQVTDFPASAQAVAVGTGTATFRSIRARGRGVPYAFGRPAGPLTEFPVRPRSIAVAGTIVLSLERGDEAGPPDLVLRDLAPGGARRALPAPAGAFAIKGAGDFAAVIAGYDARRTSL